MRELSLFSGIGGALLGSLLLGWTPIGYVENDNYCQQLLAQRIADGLLPVAPLFANVVEFIESGAAAQYRGVTDVVTATFPHQVYPTVRSRGGAHGAHNLWPATLQCIRLVQPRYCFLANIPGLVSSGYLGTLIGDLTQSGYQCRWRLLSAAEVGAPHWRKRLWIVADLEGFRPEPHHRQRHIQSGAGPAPLLDRQTANPARNPSSTSNLDYAAWWQTEPRLERLADGLPHQVDRLRTAANAHVPAVAATAWRLLTEGEGLTQSTQSERTSPSANSASSANSA